MRRGPEGEEDHRGGGEPQFVYDAFSGLAMEVGGPGGCGGDAVSAWGFFGIDEVGEGGEWRGYRCAEG